MPAPSFEGARASQTFPYYAGASSHLFKLIETNLIQRIVIFILLE